MIGALAKNDNLILFRKACDMGAWLGLVPREHSTGGNTSALKVWLSTFALRSGSTRLSFNAVM
jgi:transposase